MYKKEDKLSKENYRPITILPCVNKVLEKLVGQQIATGFDSRMYENSTAYRKHHICETTLITWKRATHESLAVNILSTDMSKAFDSLHPPLLLNKLKAYGFKDGLIQLLKSYLSDRYNRVKMGNQVSWLIKAVPRAGAATMEHFSERPPLVHSNKTNYVR